MLLIVTRDLTIFVPGSHLMGSYHAEQHEAIHDPLLRGVSQVIAVISFPAYLSMCDAVIDMATLTACFAPCSRSTQELFRHQSPPHGFLSYIFDLQPTVTQPATARHLSGSIASLPVLKGREGGDPPLSSDDISSPFGHVELFPR